MTRVASRSKAAIFLLLLLGCGFSAPYLSEVSYRATSSVAGVSSSMARSDQLTRVSTLGFWEVGVKKLATAVSAPGRQQRHNTGGT